MNCSAVLPVKFHRQLLQEDGHGASCVRSINTMLGHMDQCTDAEVAKQYTGLAKFFRTQFYFQKVMRFGDVPWYDKELGSRDSSLYKARDSRELVMSNMLNDIDDAIESLPSGKSVYRVNKWAALMLKAQFVSMKVLSENTTTSLCRDILLRTI